MEYNDHTNHKITLTKTPTRIVSLVPSQTELLYYLGTSPVGQTIFCYHPQNNFNESIKIGGTKKLQLDKIRSLKPHLIIGNKEENKKEQIAELRLEFPVWLSDIYTPVDATAMIRQIGKLVGKSKKADYLASEIDEGFQSNIKQIRGTALYLIWNHPYMAAGRNTFINSILNAHGYTNAIKEENSRYPTVSLDEIKKINPDYILLSSEPFPFKEGHISAFNSHFPEAKIRLVDGELFSWYGPRLLKTIENLRK